MWEEDLGEVTNAVVSQRRQLPSAASDTRVCPKPLLKGHSPPRFTKLGSHPKASFLRQVSNSPGLSWEVWPPRGLNLNQKPAFLLHSFNQKNEKLQTHPQQVEESQLGTEEVCYSWPKTERMKELQEFQMCGLQHKKKKRQTELQGSPYIFKEKENLENGWMWKHLHHFIK